MKALRRFVAAAVVVAGAGAAVSADSDGLYSHMETTWPGDSPGLALDVLNYNPTNASGAFEEFTNKIGHFQRLLDAEAAQASRSLKEVVDTQAAQLSLATAREEASLRQAQMSATQPAPVPQPLSPRSASWLEQEARSTHRLAGEAQGYLGLPNVQTHLGPGVEAALSLEIGRSLLLADRSVKVLDSGGSLDLAQALADYGHTVAQNARDLLAGIANGIRNTVLDAGQLVRELYGNPIGTAIRIGMALRELISPDHPKRVLGVLSRYFQDYLYGTPEQAGHVIGRLVPNIVILAASDGGSAATLGEVQEVLPAIEGSLGAEAVGDEVFNEIENRPPLHAFESEAKFIARGLSKGDQARPGFSTWIRNQGMYYDLTVGRELAEASEEFVGKVVPYIMDMGLDGKAASRLVQGEEGFSYFLTEEQYTRFIENSTSSYLGRPGALFVLPRSYAEAVQARAGQSFSAWKSELGVTWEMPAEGKTNIYRIDLPFKSEYRPRLPSFTDPGSNEFFDLDGPKPEIVVVEPPRADIIGTPVKIEDVHP